MEFNNYNHIFEKVFEIVDEDISNEFKKIPKQQFENDPVPLYSWNLDDMIKIQEMRNNKNMVVSVNNLVRAIEKLQNSNNSSVEDVICKFIFTGPVDEDGIKCHGVGE